MFENRKIVKKLTMLIRETKKPLQSWMAKLINHG